MLCAGIPRGYRSRVWQILCGYQPAHRGEEVVRRKREEYAGYVDQYFNNKEQDIHKDTFRSDQKKKQLSEGLISVAGSSSIRLGGGGTNI